MTAAIAADICVLGGGPAGAVVARRLAELGHDTLLVDRSSGDSPPRAESLAPSIVPILESLRLYGEIEAAIFARERRALLVWESDAVQEKSFASAPSLLIERTRFDANLRRAAARAGVRLMPAARARAPQRRPSGGWTVPVATADGTVIITARFLVDARGKRRRDCPDVGTPRTAAISASWDPPDRSFVETRIEAGADAWSWGSPMPDGGYAATVFLDAERIAGASTLSRAETYRRLLAQSRLLAVLLRGEMIGPVRVRDASDRIGADLIGHDFVRVGEAAVAIDPLSSQGIQDAILSAIQASAAVHTLLSSGCDPAPALEFYRERRQSAATSSRRAAARLYRAQFNRDTFWRRRSSAMEDPTADRTPPVRNATALPARVHLSPALELVDVPVLSGALIRRERALRHPRLGHPVAYLGGVALAPLVDAAGTAAATDEILARWTRRMPPETARKIIDWMWGVGILDPQPSGSGGRPASATP
jgi:flavin-dependent dehydrogenase